MTSMETETYTETVYGLGGYDPDHPTGNVVAVIETTYEVETATTSDGQDFFTRGPEASREVLFADLDREDVLHQILGTPDEDVEDRPEIGPGPKEQSEGTNP